MLKFNQNYFVNLAKEKLGNKKHTLVVTCPYDVNTIDSIYECHNLGLIDVILVGDKQQILNAINNAKIEFNDYQLYDMKDSQECAKKTMELLHNNKANMLMKGLIDTSLLLKTLLNKEYELRTNKLMTHVCLSFNENYNKYYIISDAAMTIKPTIEQKKAIIENAVWFAHCLGINNPKVAQLCAKEKVYEKMPDTMDADKIHQMYLNNEFKNCVISGPLQIDIAVDKESAEIKKVNDPVAGNADILICPNIEAANILTKGLTYLGGWSFAGLIIGSKIPFILTSRSTNKRDRVVSIALACLCAE